MDPRSTEGRPSVALELLLMLEPTRAKGIRLQHHEDVQTYGRQRVGADKDQHEVVEVLDWLQEHEDPLRRPIKIQ
jgi:hypothetical protein